MFPMMYATFTKDDRTAYLVWATSSGRIIQVNELPESWVNTDADLGRARLKSAGWRLESEGAVYDK